MKAKNKYYMLEENFPYFRKTKYPYKKKHQKSCTIYAALIVVLSACRFYMKFFQVSPWRLFYMQVKLV